MDRAVGVVAGCMLLLLVSTAGAQELAGTWSGAWIRAGDTLAVTMRFERGEEGWSGRFDSERLRVVGIPFQVVELDPPRVRLRLVGDETTTEFEGEIRGDSLAGTFQESGALSEGYGEGRFAFLRTEEPPAEIGEEEVGFRSGDIELAGSLLLPAGEGPFPAVAFLHGSGPEGRWASRYLAERLARAGVAGLIWDKRGVGASEGDWTQAGFEDLAADARAAVAFLQSHAAIDADRVGLHGHSQGATILPLAAVEESGVAFVVASAPSGVSMDEAERYSLSNALGIADMPEEEAREARAFVDAIVAVAYQAASRARLDSLAGALVDRPWFFQPPPPEDSYWSFSRRIADYDPLPAWAGVSVPVFLVFGERDERVPVARSRERITAALARGGNDRVTVHVFPEADHTYRLPPGPSGWRRTVSGYPDVVVEWVVRQVQDLR